MGELFDSLLHLEDALVQQGVQNGRLNADKAAFADGHQLGLNKGAEVGHELGFYFGHLLIWQHLSDPEDSSNKRVSEVLQKLRQLIDSFPTDPTREDLFEQLDRIRGKYRQATSLIKAPTSARYAPQTSTPTNASAEQTAPTAGSLAF